MWLSSVWVHSAKTIKSSPHFTVWWIIHVHAPKVGCPGRNCNIVGKGSNSGIFHQTQIVGGSRRTCESIESFLNCPRALAYGANSVTLIYVLGRSRAAYPLCRSRAINIITQFSKCQLTKTFCYTQNSRWYLTVPIHITYPSFWSVGDLDAPYWTWGQWSLGQS